MTENQPNPTTDTTQVCRTGVVTHTHDLEGSYLICLETCDCGNTSILPALFSEDAALVTLTIEAPESTDPRGAAGEHPRVTIHINPGEDYGHVSCLVFDACGPCLSGVWESIFSNGGGRIGVHAIPEDPDQVIFAPFRIGNWKQTRDAIKTAQDRLVTA